MNAIRAAMTVFLLAVMSSVILGWRWVAVLPPAKSEAARVVLTVAGLAAALAVVLIWRATPRRSS